METSAYHVNKYGVLCYSALPTFLQGAEAKHHNGVSFRGFSPCVRGYEVGGVDQHLYGISLVHGHYRTFNY